MSSRVALYARKSTEQRVAKEAKSVTRQLEEGQKFAAKKGWTVVAEYVDDGISGTEFEKRSGLEKMRDDAGRRQFNIIIVSEQKTLGREMFATGGLIKELSQADIDIIEYVHGKSLVPRSPMEKVIGSLRGFNDESAAVESSQRGTEALLPKARKGYVVGGRVFGYRNKDVMSGEDEHGRPLRSHVELEVKPDEAAVVLRIFEMYDRGMGLRTIAKTLTLEGATRPEPFKRKDGLSFVKGWSPSTVRAVLARELYHGVKPWFRSKKRDLWQTIRQRPRPADQHIRANVEHLRIVPEDLWLRVQARRKETEGRTLRFSDGRMSGRPPKTANRNLLAGLATCGVCGGGLVVESSARKRGRAFEYGCSRRRHNGSCTNALRIGVDDMNEAVLHAVEDHALTPEAIEQVIQLTERDDVQDIETRLTQESQDIDRRLARLIDAIEAGEDTAALRDRRKVLASRKQAITAELAALTPVPRLPRAVIDSRLAEWRRLLRGNTTQGRAVLQRVLRGRIVFTPRVDGHGYDFTAPTRFDRLFAGVACDVPRWMPRDGRGVSGLTPEDSYDADYGALLARAYAENGWRPRRDSNPCFSLERATS